MIREEAHGLLEQEDPARLQQMSTLGGSHQRSRLWQPTIQQGGKEVGLQTHPGEIALVLLGPGGQGADHVAEVVQRDARHGVVEVHHAQRLPAPLVEQHVGALGIVVYRPARGGSVAAGSARAQLLRPEARAVVRCDRRRWSGH